MKKQHMIIIGIAVCLLCMPILAGAGFWFWKKKQDEANAASPSSPPSSDPTSPTPSSPTTPQPSQAPTQTPTQPAPASALTQNASACEDATLNLSCPNGTKITSGTLTYGRWDKFTCGTIYGNPIIPSTTPVSKTFNLTDNSGTASCIGQSSCNISDYNNTLGNDPVPGVKKQIKASYSCSAS